MWGKRCLCTIQSQQSLTAEESGALFEVVTDYDTPSTRSTTTTMSDVNKRIAATLFLWFMNNNGILYNLDRTKRIADNTLVALTLMIAESRTEEKDVMVKVVVNLINKNN